jgi:hypothetical protein
MCVIVEFLGFHSFLSHQTKLLILPQTSHQIVFPEEWSEGIPGDGVIPIMPFSVDETHCCINDPRDPKFFSHKLGKGGVNYELALHIYEDSLIWMSGPHPAGKPDIVIFHEGLKDKIPLGMKGIADNGYRGEKQVLSTPNNLDEKEVYSLKPRAQACHKSFNAISRTSDASMHNSATGLIITKSCLKPSQVFVNIRWKMDLLCLTSSSSIAKQNFLHCLTISISYLCNMIISPSSTFQHKKLKIE